MAQNNVDSPVAPAAAPDAVNDSLTPPAGGAPADGADLEVPEVSGDSPAERGDVSTDQALDMLGDVELDVKIELGRCQMLVGDVLKLQDGDIVELDKLAGDPVDVYVNDRLVARGEVLVVNENFCVRINQIVAKED